MGIRVLGHIWKLASSWRGWQRLGASTGVQGVCPWLGRGCSGASRSVQEHPFFFVCITIFCSIWWRGLVITWWRSGKPAHSRDDVGSTPESRYAQGTWATRHIVAYAPESEPIGIGIAKRPRSSTAKTRKKARRAAH